MSFNGGLSTTQSNWLKFDFYNGHLGDYEFNGQSILFQSDRLPYGSVVDINKAREHSSDPNEVEIPLIDVPAGTYNQWSPYGTLTLTIGTRLLADLDDSKTINYIDFVLLAQDWQNPVQGQYIGDITGASGIPDGYVDSWDLLELVNSWMDSLP